MKPLLHCPIVRKSTKIASTACGCLDRPKIRLIERRSSASPFPISDLLLIDYHFLSTSITSSPTEPLTVQDQAKTLTSSNPKQPILMPTKLINLIMLVKFYWLKNQSFKLNFLDKTFETTNTCDIMKKVCKNGFFYLLPSVRIINTVNKYTLKYIIPDELFSPLCNLKNFGAVLDINWQRKLAWRIEYFYVWNNFQTRTKKKRYYMFNCFVCVSVCDIVALKRMNR